MSEREYCAVSFFSPHKNAPEFILWNIVIDVEKFIKQYIEHLDKDGKVTIDVRMSKGGKRYTDYNDWKLTTPAVDQPKTDVKDDDVPF